MGVFSFHSLVLMKVTVVLTLVVVCLTLSVLQVDAQKGGKGGKTGKGGKATQGETSGPVNGKGGKAGKVGKGGKGSETTNSGAETCTCNTLTTMRSQDLNSEHAMEMIRLVTEKAKEVQVPVSICIRDKHDNLVAHIRMTNAVLGSVDLACQKARSSALFPFPSAAFAASSGNIEMSNGIISNIGGGLPLITSSGVSVGSIGVSGATTAEQDVEIATAGASAIDLILENF